MIDESPSTVTFSFTPIATWVTIARTTAPALHSFIATISPPLTSFSLVGTTTLSIVLTDSLSAISRYSFSITVRNTEPVFTGLLPATAILVNVGVTSYYSLPPMSDAEGHSITVTNNFGAGNTFTSYDAINKKYKFTQLDNSVTGTFTI